MHPRWAILIVLLGLTLSRADPQPDPEPEPEPEPEADPQMSMMPNMPNPFARPPYNPMPAPSNGGFLPGQTRQPSPCEMTNQCCGFANQNCCMGGKKTYTVWKRKCDQTTNTQQCRTRVEKFCSNQMVRDCRIESEVRYLDFEAEQCMPKPLRKCFTYERKVCQQSTYPASKNVSWQIEELVLNQQKVETTCRDMTSYNCTDIPWTETVRVPVQKTRVVPQTRTQCQNIRVPGEAETRQIPITRIVYKEQCYNMPSTVCSTGAACGQQPQPQRCPYNQVACPFSNQQNAYKNVTICPLTGQPIGQPAYNPNQRPDMYPGQGYNPNQRPNMYPSPSPCQAVRQLACGAAPGGSCGAQQQCCRQVMRKVCQRVPQKVVETQTMTRPTWKWEQRCDNITFQRTEYYTETETKEIPRTRQDCRKVSENKCFNITIPEYGVKTSDRSQMVSVQLPRCQPRTEQATYCHNFPTGDTECKRIPIKKGFRINKVVCDKEASRPYCVNIPRMDCELKPGTSCRMVPETVSVPTCNESPQCQQCNNFTQGPGFGSCPTSTCDAYIDPNAEGNVPGSFPMVPGQTLDPFTKLPGQTLDPFIANGSMGGEGELVELGCQGTGGSDGQGRTFYPCPSGGTGGTFTPGTGCKNCYGCEGSCTHMTPGH